ATPRTACARRWAATSRWPTPRTASAANRSWRRSSGGRLSLFSQTLYTSCPAKAGHDVREVQGASIVRLLRGQVQQFEPRELRAFVGHLEIARHRIAPELERVWFVGGARRHHPDLGDRVVELGMV